MRTALAFLIQFAIVAAVVVGVWYVLRIGEERASQSAPAPAAPPEAPGSEEIRPAAPAGEPEPAAVEPESVAKEEHAPPKLS